MRKTIITTATTIIASAIIILTASPITSFAAGSITLDQAKQIALNNAGLKANQVTFVKEGTEIDDGRTQFEIEFYSGNTEYDFDIDAATGAIISFDQDIETAYAPAAKAPAAAAKTTSVTKDQALQIALNHAGVKKSDAAFTSVKKDFDDGVEKWEVEFHVGFNEYNYDIAVSNGQIIDFEIDD